MSYSEKITPFIIPFIQRLKTINPELPGVDHYCNTYLSHILKHSNYYTRIYAQALNILLRHSNQGKNSLILLDYGAGNGLLGIFAKFCGFKKVYINDISPEFIEAAKLLAIKLDITIDGFITGDINTVTLYFNEKDKPNAVVGTDVIEHVYNLDNLFKGLILLNKNMTTVFTTAANAHNWLKAKAIKKQQVLDEYSGGALPGNKLSGSENSPAFFVTRQKIIQSSGIVLTEAEILLLTKATRGLIKDDILTAVSMYKKDQVVPVPPSHPSNTCDPVTGSWAERLLTVDQYRELYKNAGFELHQYNGFYNGYESNFKSKVLKAANLLVKFTGIYLAPYILLIGTPLAKKE
jgi:2-polyprenyl-3-methyl-5-hydroxy-6-metoxy-1,4-benzoquinol methylase